MAAVATPQKPIQVPWTQKQEESIRALVESGDRTPWALGDEALAAVPMGDVPGRTTGGQKFIRLLAARTGTEFDHLERSRRVANAWPPRFRNLGATWGAHQAWTEGGAAKASERASVLKRLAKDAPHGKVTADDVRKERAKEMGASYRARTPEARLLALCDKARSFVGPFGVEVTRHLLDFEVNEKWRERNLDLIRLRADQLRYAADLLEMVTDGGEMPPKEEIRERLDPKAW